MLAGLSQQYTPISKWLLGVKEASEEGLKFCLDPVNNSILHPKLKSQYHANEAETWADE